MIPSFTSLLKTVTGKVIIGVTVVTMGVGAAAAAGAELPLLMTVGAPDEDSSEEQSSEEESSEEESSEEESSEEESSEEESSEDESSEEEFSQVKSSDAESSEESSGDEPDAEPNHGTVVSEFTQGTDLTGCEKGQATAAVARGDVDPAELGDAELADALAPYIAKCDRGDGDDEGDEAASEEDSDEDGWKDLRDLEKAIWLDAKSAFETECGDEDGDEAEKVDDDDGDDELSPECRAMKAELKQLHEAGKAFWKDARDAEHADRKAERDEAKLDRAEAKAERKASKVSSGKAKGKNKGG